MAKWRRCKVISKISYREEGEDLIRVGSNVTVLNTEELSEEDEFENLTFNQIEEDNNPLGEPQPENQLGKTLIELGKEGWELTSQTCRSYWAGGLLVITDVYILKRPNK